MKKREEREISHVQGDREGTWEREIRTRPEEKNKSKREKKSRERREREGAATHRGPHDQAMGSKALGRRCRRVPATDSRGWCQPREERGWFVRLMGDVSDGNLVES